MRESRKWSQTELADFLGDVTFATISKWEKGISPIPQWAQDKLLSSVRLSLPLHELAELLSYAREDGKTFEETLALALRAYLHSRKPPGNVNPINYADIPIPDGTGTARVASDSPGSGD
ncbi:MAG: helix-turn-helix transcriptional regulator [Xanthomonadales bacterium]|nr:helix-turn-helix transcriptional regulator [Xanthomonadales bacterium]